MHLGQLGQRGDTSLEGLLLSLDRILEILTQRHTVEGTHEDSLGLVLGIGHHIVGALAQERKHTTFQQQGLDVLLGVERTCRLLAIALHTNAEQLATVATLHH